MENKLHLKITTHQHVIFDDDVEEIYSKSTVGEFGILPNHEPFMCALDVGVTKVVLKHEVLFFAIMGGVFQLKNNQALILTPIAENGSDIDVTRAKEAKERAEARLSAQKTDIDAQRAELALSKAITRLKAANK
ncbi:ATP synthase F1 subunit epsilon [bacterium]|nr:ATP synthase F1 subunit epsilon [bacterium]